MKGSIAVWWKEDISDQTFRKLENIWDIFSFFFLKDVMITEGTKVFSYL